MTDIKQISTIIHEYNAIIIKVKTILKKYFHWDGGIDRIEAGTTYIYIYNYDAECYSMPIVWLFMSDDELDIAIKKYKENKLKS